MGKISTVETSLQFKGALAHCSDNVSSTIAEIVSATKEAIGNHPMPALKLSKFSQKVVSRLSADDAAELPRILYEVTRPYGAGIVNLKRSPNSLSQMHANLNFT